VGPPGLGQELAQQGPAALVSPLRVVDPDDERLAPSHGGEELLEPAARLTKGLRAAAPLDPPGALRDRLDAPQHGEDPDQRLGLQRIGRRDVRPGLQPQKPTQIVDGPVQGVERDGLLRMAPPAEHGGSLVRGLLQEAPGKLALADARRAVDVHDRRLASARVVERSAEHA
jgi:hypothetical protein